MASIEKQIAALTELSKHSHAFFKSEEAHEEFLSPFGIPKSQLEKTEKCEGGLGLQGHNGESELTGICAFDIPPAIMVKLGIKSNSRSYGRGRKFREEIDQIITELKRVN
jgi:hypothetical protein